MPKIIENVKRSILEAARRQLLEGGYSHMTMRAVAAESNIAVGTLYNYFESKEILTVDFVLEDWMSMLNIIKEKCSNAENVEQLIHCIHSELTKFGQHYAPLFTDKGAQKGFYASVRQQHHCILVEQLAAVISDGCANMGVEINPLLPKFVAESLLTWTYSECEYKHLEELLLKLF